MVHAPAIVKLFLSYYPVLCFVIFNFVVNPLIGSLSLEEKVIETSCRPKVLIKLARDKILQTKKGKSENCLFVLIITFSRVKNLPTFAVADC